jgi:hypothetical protein
MMNWYLVLLFSFLGSEIKSTSRKRNVVKWHLKNRSITHFIGYTCTCITAIKQYYRFDQSVSNSISIY